MKTKNIILSAGLIGLAYLVYKNSKQKTEVLQEDTSGGGGGIGGGGIGGGVIGGVYPILPPIMGQPNINIVVPPVPRPFVNPRPYGTRSEPLSLSQVEEAPDVPSTSNSNTTTGGTTSAPHGAGYTPLSSGSAESQP
jgi:hypothetical protein